MRKFYGSEEGSGGQIDWRKECTRLQQQLKEKDEKIEYWKQRCLLAEKCYDRLYMRERYVNEYAEWQQLKSKQENNL